MKLRVQKNSPCGTLILSSPENKNALSRELVQDLIQAFGDYHREKSVRAVVLSASGATFCSGVDLKEWGKVKESEDPLDAWQDVATELQDLVETMLRFPKPIIAAIDGPVIGAGLALVLASDLVVGTDKTTFYSNAPKLGLVSGLVAPLAHYRIGASIASRLLLANEPITAELAHRWGMIHYLVPSEHVWINGSQLATQIAETAPESIQMTKRLLNEMVGESLWTHLVSGSAVMATVCSSEAAIEGLNAFQEKRTPKFP